MAGRPPRGAKAGQLGITAVGAPWGAAQPPRTQQYPHEQQGGQEQSGRTARRDTCDHAEDAYQYDRPQLPPGTLEVPALLGGQQHACVSQPALDAVQRLLDRWRAGKLGLRHGRLGRKVDGPLQFTRVRADGPDGPDAPSAGRCNAAGHVHSAQHRKHGQLTPAMQVGDVVGVVQAGY